MVGGPAPARRCPSPAEGSPSTEGSPTHTIAVLRCHLYWRVRQDQSHHAPHQRPSRDRANQDETPTFEPCHGGIPATADRSVIGTADCGRGRLAVVFSACPRSKEEQQGDPVGC